ncbi:MAG: hypothetical protein CK425_05085 [Parachlamydia sp.]|nr:MAG: hypothetical protein CK425_05085 [Parachlamydia sp.]
MALSISDIVNLNSYQIKQNLKIEKEELPKYFCLNRKNKFSIVKDTIITKIYRLKHLILHRIWINEKKIKRFETIKATNSALFEKPTTPPPCGTAATAAFSKAYGLKQIEHFPRFSTFKITPGTLIVAPQPPSKETAPSPTRPSLFLEKQWNAFEIQQIKNQTNIPLPILQNYLVMAAVGGEFEFVKWLVETHHMEVNFFENDRSPLCAALAANQPKIAAFFLEKGASPNFSKHPYCTPLELAVIYDFPELTNELINRGAELHKKNDQNSSLVENAIIYKSHKALKVILAHGAKIESTDLLGAIIEEDPVSLKLLLEHQADPATEHNHSPLYALALQATNPELIELMLHHGLTYQDHSGNMSDRFRLVFNANVSPKVLEFFIQHKGFQGEPYAISGAYNHFYISQEIAHLDVFHRNGVNPKQHQDWLRQKFLAHRFDLEAQGSFAGNEVTLNGFDAAFTISEMSFSLDAFFKNHPPAESPGLTQNARQNILNAFKQNFVDRFLSPEQRAKNQHTCYHQGKPVLVASGFKDHAYYRVLYKGVMTENNRGREFESATPPGTQMYRIIDPSAASFSLMRSTEKAQPEDLEARQTLHTALKAKNIICFKYKAQKAGICAWAGLKTAFRSMLYLSLLEELQKTLPNDQAASQAEIQADKMYKKWSAWDREYALKNALSFYKSETEITANKALLTQIAQKFKGSKETLNELKALL